MLRKKLIVAGAILTVALSGCAATPSTNEQPPATQTEEPSPSPLPETETENPIETPTETETPAPTTVEGETKMSEPSPQFSEIKKGEEIAVMTTNMGVIKLRFFPELAPKAVENFITHAKNGYYNGIKFHRVINDFMIQGGDPTGDGTGGESIWGTSFEDEFSYGLRNIRGALSMANAGENTNGSQFFIVQKPTLYEQEAQDFEFAKENINEIIGQDGDGKDIAIKDAFPLDIVESYIANGGTPSLDFKHTVFGHVIEGMDIVDKIAAVETDEKDKPKEDVVIEKIEFEKY